MLITTNAQSIVGFSKDREKNDFYPSPPHTIYDLVEYESFDDGLIWEPACGDGAMSEPLKDIYGDDKVYSTDLIDRGYGDKTGIDFLNNNLGINPDYIITNPPYKHGKEFVLEALKKANKKVAMLMKLVFLESKSRYKMFKNTPLKKVLVYSKRLEIYKNGVEQENSGLIAYAWFIWDKRYNGKPKIDWILKGEQQSLFE